MPRIIDLSNPYVLDETGDEVEKVLGLPYGDVALTDAEKQQVRDNIGADNIQMDETPSPYSTRPVTSRGIYEWVLQQLQELKTVESVAITIEPTKRLYYVGDTLDLSGIRVTATYTDGTTGDVTDLCTFSPASGATLSENETTEVRVSYRTYVMSFHVFVTTPYLEFHSANTFQLRTNNNLKNWDGTLEYSTNGTTWTEWNGTDTLTAGTIGGEYSLRLRGTGNHVIVGTTNARRWVLTGTAVKCSGDITMLLDYQHPESITMEDGAFEYWMDGRSALIEAPQLSPVSVPKQGYLNMFSETSITETPVMPAKTVGQSGYMNMFSGCSSLLTAHDIEAGSLGNGACNTMFQLCTSLQNTPAIKAVALDQLSLFGMFYGCTGLTRLAELATLTLKKNCYKQMYNGCTGIKVSETSGGIYQHPFRVPADGTGVDATDSMLDMLTNTGGTFTGTPTINTTYYTDQQPVPAV